MSKRQREELRAAFARLNVTVAKEQYALVETLTGRVIRSPGELDADQARALLIQLSRRAASMDRASTGNAWVDRDEDTWIDKL